MTLAAAPCSLEQLPSPRGCVRLRSSRSSMNTVYLKDAEPGGASLLAIAAGQSALMLNVAPPS
ncbi:MAG: hypothetical protein ABWY46_22170, partial [Pseudomonas sp.]